MFFPPGYTNKAIWFLDFEIYPLFDWPIFYFYDCDERKVDYRKNVLVGTLQSVCVPWSKWLWPQWPVQTFVHSLLNKYSRDTSLHSYLWSKWSSFPVGQELCDEHRWILRLLLRGTTKKCRKAMSRRQHTSILLKVNIIWFSWTLQKVLSVGLLGVPEVG